MERVVNMFCCSYPHCHKKYLSKFNLKRHIEVVHYHIRNYECSSCHYKFASKQNLREHEYVHTGARPFVCKLCSASFRQASQLSLHKRSHNQKRTFCELPKNALKPLDAKAELDVTNYI
mmetsp:Transcript_14077/g.26366  ORF Transcript_14077/g.26366 Transcript_14077/m.26366 type:complete len:119 (+) Transcript_14077:333-689(+)